MARTNERPTSSISSKAPRKSKEVSRKEIEAEQRAPQVSKPGDVPLIKKKAKGPKKPSKKKHGSISASYPYEKCLDAFNKCEFTQTRWVDEEALESLGIKDDVKAIMKNIGIESLLTMKHEAYYEIAVQFLASLEIHISGIKPKTIGNLGSIRWKAFGINYEMTFEKLCEVYGFKGSTTTDCANDDIANKALWKLIGHGEFVASNTRASMIRNPAIRYIHKLLANTLLWRQGADRVTTDDMILLAKGLRPLHRQAFSGKGIPSRDVNLGVLLARKLVALKPWVLRNKKNVAKLSIGGLLYPIFLDHSHAMGRPCKEARETMDIPYLKKAKILGDQVDNLHIYRFTFKGNTVSKVLLPNHEITSVKVLRNLEFKLEDGLLFGDEAEDEAEDEIPLMIEDASDSPLSHHVQEIVEVVEERDEEETQVFGSARYYQKPYEGVVSDPATRHALNGVEKTQRFCKYGYRNLRKSHKSLLKRYKNLERKVDELMARMGSCSCTHMLDGVQGAPSHGQGAKRKRRSQKSPTPSPPMSDNPSMDCSNSDSN